MLKRYVVCSVQALRGTERAKLEHLEEERRLLHVAVTRAKERAYITYVRMAFNWGRLQEATKSTILEAMQSTMALRSFPKDDVEERSGSRSHRDYWY